MLALLPLLTLILLFLIFSAKPAADLQSADWRRAWIHACVLFGSILIIATQALSILNLITFAGMIITWSIILLATAVCLSSRLRNDYRLGFGFSDIPIASSILLLLMGFICLLLAVVAYCSPPNNWDSVVYHMPRVMHWIQNQNVAFYPTHCLRQNHQSMGSEFFILHLQILSGGDHFANFVNWFSMIGSLIGVSLIAKLLGAGVRGQVLAAIFAGTIPMGVMQATSTQSDYANAFWMVCFAYYLILYMRKPEMSRTAFVGIGASLGLAVITKATTYLIAAPFLVWLGVVMIQRSRWSVWKPVAIIAAIFMVLNVSNYVRNTELYGHPLGPRTEGGEYRYKNDVITPAVFLSNVARNLALHCNLWPEVDAGKTPPFLTKVQKKIEKGILEFHQYIGIDPNDPRTTWPRAKFKIEPILFNDENDGNPLQLAIILILTFAMPIIFALRLIRREGRPPSSIILLWTCAIAAFFIFCAYLRWQPWHSRLHIALFLLLAPAVGYMLDWLPRNRAARWSLVAAGNILAIAMICMGFIWTVNNMQRTLRGPYSVIEKDRRDDLLYSIAPRDEFVRMALFMKVNNVKSVGLVTAGEAMEYMVWRAIQVHANPDIIIRDVLVDNVSKSLADKPPYSDFMPDAIVVCKQPSFATVPSVVFDYHGKTYARSWQLDWNDVYMRKN